MAGNGWKNLERNLAKLAGAPSRIVRPVVSRLNVLIAEEFRTGANSYGEPWAKLRPSTVRKKKGSTLIMIDTGETRAETRAVARGGAGIALLSTKQAGYHMGKGPYGRPARPVFPHRRALPERWQDAIRIEWERVFRSTFGGL